MKNYKIDFLKGEQLSSTVQADELCIVISSTSGLSPWSTALKSKSIEALRRNVHFLTIHTGFFEDGRKPWVCLEYQHAGENGLEERWVGQEWLKSLQQTFSSRKLVVFFDQGCTAKDLVRAEDIITAFASPLYESSLWQSVRMFAHNLAELTKADPDYQLRFQHQMEYRRWVNENPDSLTSIEIGMRLQEFAKANGCDFISLDESMLRDQGMNLLLAVGQGAKKSPSRLHIVTANLDSSSGKKPIALIGKGITFDTGGINLKPHESFVNCMKNDMGGAGLFSQLFMGLIKSGYKDPIILAIPCCENAIDANSMKPGVVIKSRSGKSVIIEHTDAEGRLILADAMSYIWDQYKPEHMYTAATLTTASLRQFGPYYTPVHFAEPRFKKSLQAASEQSSELFTFWDTFLPFLQGNKTNAADLTNMGRLASHASMGGGSNVAAHFLKQFAKGPYTHLDIFNSIWNWSGDYPGAHYGCTGSVFNSLWHVFKTPT